VSVLLTPQLIKAAIWRRNLRARYASSPCE